MKGKSFIITAAGGNATAIKVLDSALSRDKYEELGRELMANTEKHGVEQCGFLIPDDNHFEMSGGEFCGNAARSTAILFHQIHGKNEVAFSMSGFPHKVHSVVKPLGKNKYDVQCTFENLQTDSQPVEANGQSASLVDMGGIVHVVIEGEFPHDYEKQHRAITQSLGLSKRDAVGVIWYHRSDKQIIMHPVVWVRGIDSFFYETSCGSGTIAVGKTTGAESIVQPSGKQINVKSANSAVTLQSEMEITHEFTQH